jgi:stage II sporulation protein D
MYYGMSRETPRTNEAVQSSSGQVVKYGDKVAVTYYFSSSGGRTENIENAFIGSSPVPYLKSVDDPYDSAAPQHRWRFTWSRSQLDRRLGGWVKGKLRTVKVVQRGVSPRVVSAQVVGSRGSVNVTGPQLRTRLGLFDTWVYFVTIKSGQQGTAGSGSPDTGGITDGGGTAARTARLSWMRKLLGPRQLIVGGTVWPKPKRLTLQMLDGRRWKTLGRGHTDGRGRYSLLVRSAGTYRVLANGAVGPVTRVR